MRDIRRIITLCSLLNELGEDSICCIEDVSVLTDKTIKGLTYITILMVHLESLKWECEEMANKKERKERRKLLERIRAELRKLEQ